VRPAPYLQRPLPLALIFGSFLFVAVPGWLYASRFADQGSDGVRAVMVTPVVLGFLGVFALTHFFLTFAVFLQTANWRHFTSSRRNTVRFVAIPFAALLGLFLYGASGVGVAVPMLGVAVAFTIRAFDFFHLTRQSYGVTQLFKGPTASHLPKWVRDCENAFVLAGALLLYTTFITDMTFDPGQPLGPIAAALYAALGVAVRAGYALGFKRGGTAKDLGLPLAYLALQTLALIPSALWTGFYAFTLTIHYVEYHVLMAPRCFDTPLDEKAKLDRAFGALRAKKAVFYGLLLALSGVWVALQVWNIPPGPASASGRALVHLFDGLYVFHYIVEMFIWKFSDPFFKKQLLAMYR
jgi:hypothetical protein